MLFLNAELDNDVPAFLAPVLDFLADALPWPVYSIVVKLLSHILAIATATTALVVSLFSTHPHDWDVQTVLPPIISILVAYLALVSLYRTTSWLIRTSVWFMKWSIIIAVLFGGLGWYFGNANGVGGYSALPNIASSLLSLLNEQGRNENTGGRRNTPLRSSKSAKTKPKSWEPYDRHREWRNEKKAPEDVMTDAQKLMNDIGDMANSILSGWKVFGGKMDISEDQAKKSKTRSR